MNLMESRVSTLIKPVTKLMTGASASTSGKITTPMLPLCKMGLTPTSSSHLPKVGHTLGDSISSAIKTVKGVAGDSATVITKPIKRIAQSVDTSIAKRLWSKILKTPPEQRVGKRWEQLKAAYDKVQGRRIVRMGDGVPLKRIGPGSNGLPDVERVPLMQLSSYKPDYTETIYEELESI